MAKKKLTPREKVVKRINDRMKDTAKHGKRKEDRDVAKRVINRVKQRNKK